MIDPANVIKFDRDDHELQEFFIFALSVAGKSSYVQARKVHDLIHEALAFAGPAEMLPLEKIRVAAEAGRLRAAMEIVKLGQYTRIERALREFLDRGLSLRTCSEDDLAGLHGCNFKTAKFFLVYSRPGMRAAVLDTHVLRFFREIGVDAPAVSPQKRAEYERFERYFQALADFMGLSCAELDEALWRRSARITRPSTSPHEASERRSARISGPRAAAGDQMHLDGLTV